MTSTSFMTSRMPARRHRRTPFEPHDCTSIAQNSGRLDTKKLLAWKADVRISHLDVRHGQRVHLRRREHEPCSCQVALRLSAALAVQAAVRVLRHPLHVGQHFLPVPFVNALPHCKGLGKEVPKDLLARTEPAFLDLLRAGQIGGSELDGDVVVALKYEVADPGEGKRRVLEIHGKRPTVQLG